MIFTPTKERIVMADGRVLTVTGHTVAHTKAQRRRARTLRTLERKMKHTPEYRETYWRNVPVEPEPRTTIRNVVVRNAGEWFSGAVPFKTITNITLTVTE